MKKKILSIVLALVLVLSMGTVAFADTDYEDMSTVTLTKEYKQTNPGTTSPAETFTFTELTCTEVKDAGVNVTKDNAPVPQIANVEYKAGEAGGAKARKDITITLPTYNAVGIYTYEFSEIDNNTAGVTYRGGVIKLVVTVIEQNGKVRVAAIHTENADEKKSASFDNTYSAGSLSVTKNVTGLLGDKAKEFTVKVEFTAPSGDTVREAITYTEDGVVKTIPTTAWTEGRAFVEISLHDAETITFGNIPYGVTYNVTENDYSSEGYTVTYDSTRNGKIEASTTSTDITNDKGGEVDMGIGLDSLPYVLMLVVVGAGMIVFFSKKRAARED